MEKLPLLCISLNVKKALPVVNKAEVAFAEAGWQNLQTRIYHTPSSQRRSSAVPSWALLCWEILQTLTPIGQKLSRIPLTRAHRRCTPSFWQERLALRSVDKTCQISPTRRYTRSWYTGTSILKKWLQALTPFLSQFPSILILCLHFLNFLTRLYISRSLEPAKACS